MPQKKSPVPIIWAAMLVGQIALLVITIVLRRSGAFSPAVATDHDGRPMNTMIFVGVGAMLLAVAAAVSIAMRVLPTRARDGNPPTRQSVQAKQIGQMALIEGPAIFGSIIYLLTGSFGGLAIAGIAILLFVVTAYPSQREGAGLLQGANPNP